MAGSIKTQYGASNQTITITIASLANNGAQQSNVISNTSDLFLDDLVFLKIKSPASSTSASGYINVYAAGSCDGGTLYSDGATGSNGSITLTSPPNVKPIGIINVVANGTTYYAGPFSVGSAFGGILPEKWSLIIENKTGGTLDTTGGNHSVFYQGILSQYT